MWLNRSSAPTLGFPFREQSGLLKTGAPAFLSFICLLVPSMWGEGLWEGLIITTCRLSAALHPLQSSLERGLVGWGWESPDG